MHWTVGYRAIALFQVLLTVVLVVSLPGGGFQSTVAEETEHHFPGARQGKHLPQAQCLQGGSFGARCV